MPENESKKITSRLRKTFRLIWRGVKWLLLIVITLTIIYIVWTNHRGQVAAEAEMQKLADRNIAPTPTEPLDESKNAARFYSAAADVFALDDSLMIKTPVNGYANWPLFGEGFSPEQAAHLQEVIRNNQIGFLILRQVHPDDPCEFNLDPIEDTTNFLPTLASTRRIGRWCNIDSYEASSTGDLDRAVVDCLIVLTLTRQMAYKDYTIVHLVRISLAALTEGMVEQLLSRSELTDLQLASLQAAIRDTSASLVYIDLLRTELDNMAVGLRYPLWHIHRDAFYEQDTRRRLSGMTDFRFDPSSDFFVSIEEPTWWDEVSSATRMTFLSWCPGYAQADLAHEVRLVIDLYDVVNDPTITQQTLVALSQKNGETTLVNSCLATLREQLWIQAKMSATIAALEVERFRLRENRWPTSLNEVYTTVPVCPYGHKLQFVSKNGELRIYSIGPNGIDDKGIGLDDDLMIDDTSDDVHFILLDPDQRNRPATTPLVNSDFIWNEETGEYELDWSDKDSGLGLKSNTSVPDEKSKQESSP